MRIVGISDLHGHLPEIPSCNVLVIAGDICPDFDPMKGSYDYVDKTGQRQRHWLDTEFRAWLDEVPADHVVAIAGNHDFVFEHSFLIPDLPWYYLRDSEVALRGALSSARFWGTPWVPNLPSWAFNARDEALQARAEAIPEGIDVLVTHGPPYGFGDYIPGGSYATFNRGLNNVGEPHLNDAIKRVRPKLVFCGHIHEAYGKYQLGDTVIYNASINNEVYDPVNAPVVVDL